MTDEELNRRIEEVASPLRARITVLAESLREANAMLENLTPRFKEEAEALLLVRRNALRALLRAEQPAHYTEVR